MDNLIFGGLLESSNTKELEKFLNNMEPKDSLRMLEVGLAYCQGNGLFTIEESHILHIALNKLKMSIEELKTNNE